MPEVQEVFRMATQKVDQEPGALDRQVVKQRKAVRNRRLGAFATVLIFVAIAVAALALTRSNKQAPATTPSTSVPKASGSMLDLRTGDVTPLPSSIAKSFNYFAVSPDHTTLAFSSCCATFGPVYTANIDGTQLSQVSSSGQNGFAAQWSPDGSLLVYQQKDYFGHLGDLYVWNVATGQPTRVTNLDQTHSWGYWAVLPSFASDGRSILFQLPRGNHNNQIEDLWSVPVTGGKQTLVRRNAGSGYYSPDGRWLAYLTSGAKNQDALWITGVHGGRPRMLVRQANLGWLRWSPDATRISYLGDDGIYVLNVATGSATKVAEGGKAEWFDDNTLIVGYPST
jgi:Tol biopolymer transport system component